MNKKKKNKVSKNGPVYHRTAEQATLDKMPKYNGYAIGHGPIGDTRYNRNKEKRSWERELKDL